MLCIKLFLPIMDTELLRTPSAQSTLYSQNLPRLTWKRCSSKTCTSCVLNQNSSPQSLMMRVAALLFLSTAETILFRSTRFVTRTQAALAESSWSARSTQIPLVTTTTMRETSFLDTPSSWAASSSNSWRLTSIPRTIWRITQMFSLSPLLTAFSQR